MSEIKLKRIISYSSQDSVQKAENLLNTDGDRKWLKSNDDEETKSHVVIELEKPSFIRQIDIENASSGFIEILAGNESDDEDDYVVLLPVVSFMTPSECKNQINTTRLKIFTEETNLAKDTINKKWTRVKIVCTQPFNKSIQFGITFVKFYSEGVSNDDIKDAAKIQTGAFSLKKELSGGSSDTKASLDDNSMDKTESKSDTPTTTASTQPVSIFDKWKNKSSNENKLKKSSSDEDMDDTSTSNSKSKKSDTDYTKSKPKTSKDEDDTKDENTNTKNSKSSSSIPSTSSNSNKKSSASNENKSTAVRSKPILKEQTLKGVIFALSGFQNPLRSELRDQGINLGAKYRPDWTDDCTHLICAFPNTPKAAQVRKSGGIIVNKQWLTDCEKKGHIVDIKNYKLKNKKKSNSDDDDDDDDDEDDDDDGVNQKPRKAAKNAKQRISKLKNIDDDSFDEEEAENSDDRDFVVNSSDEEDLGMLPDDDDDDDDEEDEEESFDSDDSEAAVSKKKKKKKTKKLKKSKSDSSSSSIDSSSSSSPSSSSETDIEMYKLKKEKELLKNKKKETKSETINIKKSPPKEEEDKVAADDKDNDKEDKKDQAKSSDNSADTNGKNKEKSDKKNEPKTMTNKKKEIVYDDDDDEDGKNKKPSNKRSLSQISDKTELNSDLEQQQEDESPKSKETKSTESSKTNDSKKSKTDQQEDNDDDDDDSWQLPSFFEDKNFFIYADFDQKRKNLLSRIIIGFGGDLHDYMSDKVEFVITDKSWNKDFEESLKENKNLKFVSADWIDACARRKKLMAYKPFEISSDD